MHQPWFPTRKASKLTFAFFQFAGWWSYLCFQLAWKCHHQANWKQANVSFEAFLVGNQGWPIKGQMLRQFMRCPKSIFRFIRPVHAQLKTDNVDYLKKPPWKKFFLYIFAIHLSSRYEKRCQMCVRLFCLFYGSKNQGCWVY